MCKKKKQGLIGSTYYVNQLSNNGFNVVSSIQQDMTAFSGRFYGKVLFGGITSRIYPHEQKKKPPVVLLLLVRVLV